MGLKCSDMINVILIPSRHVRLSFFVQALFQFPLLVRIQIALRFLHPGEKCHEEESDTGNCDAEPKYGFVAFERPNRIHRLRLDNVCKAKTECDA